MSNYRTQSEDTSLWAERLLIKSWRAAAPWEKIPFATTEDLIIAKLVWFKKDREVSDRQWRDILGVLKIQAKAIDREYLMKMADTMQVQNLLQRALGEAGLGNV